MGFVYGFTVVGLYGYKVCLRLWGFTVVGVVHGFTIMSSVRADLQSWLQIQRYVKTHHDP